MIVKTMLVASPHLVHAYRMCRAGQPQASGSVCFEGLSSLVGISPNAVLYIIYFDHYGIMEI